MRLNAILCVLLAGASAGCAPGVSGQVIDAADGTPMPGATVELNDTGWGMQAGGLVWDAPTVQRTRTDAQGRFAFNQSGGLALRVTAPGQAPLITPLCPMSPMIVRFGGPTGAPRVEHRLVFGPTGDGTGTPAANLGLAASGDALGDGSVLTLTAHDGLRFVPGTGTLPKVPKAGWTQRLTLDTASECGWVFVRRGGAAAAVVQAAKPSAEQDPGGATRHVLLFAPL